MKFRLDGRVGKRLLNQELEAPSVEAAIEEAKRRLEEYQNKEGGEGRVLIDLHLVLSPVWEAHNWGGKVSMEEWGEYSISLANRIAVLQPSV